MSIKFYVVDTETSGLSNIHHEITEISLIRCADRMQLTRRIRAHMPMNASWDALKITGQTIESISKGEEKIDAINEFERFIFEDGVGPSHRALICHNVSFDRKFLCSLWGKYNKIFPFNIYIDTVSMFRDYCKKQGIIKPKANLTAAIEFLKLRKYSSHTAEGDTRSTYLLWEKLISLGVDWLEYAKHLPHNIEL